MIEPRNLSPEEWSRVLNTNDSPELLADNLRNNKVLPWAQTLIDCTRDSESTIDLGSGAGQNSAFLALKGKNTTLLDLSENNVAFSRMLFGMLGLKGNFYQADMTKPLPFPENSFDVVFSCGVFEYFSDAEIENILKEAFRVARKRVIIMAPNAASFLYRFGMFYMRMAKRWQWGGERPFYSLRKYFLKAGSGEIKEFSVGAKHSLNFLTMPLGGFIKKALIKFFNLKNHAKPSFLNQGYLLVTIGEKAGK